MPVYTIERIGKYRTLTFGLVVAGIFLIKFGVSNDPTVMFASAFLATTGLAITRPSIEGLLTDISRHKERGKIVGVWDVSEDVGYVIGPLVAGIVTEYFHSGVVRSESVYDNDQLTFRREYDTDGQLVKEEY